MITITTPPAYPKHCPICGERVYPLYHTMTYAPPVPPVDAWAWEWTARCWNGHLVDPLPEQLTLIANSKLPLGLKPRGFTLAQAKMHMGRHSLAG